MLKCDVCFRSLELATLQPVPATRVVKATVEGFTPPEPANVRLSAPWHNAWRGHVGRNKTQDWRVCGGCVSRLEGWEKRPTSGPVAASLDELRARPGLMPVENDEQLQADLREMVERLRQETQTWRYLSSRGWIWAAVATLLACLPLVFLHWGLMFVSPVAALAAAATVFGVAWSRQDAAAARYCPACDERFPPPGHSGRRDRYRVREILSAWFAEGDQVAMRLWAHLTTRWDITRAEAERQREAFEYNQRLNRMIEDY